MGIQYSAATLYKKFARKGRYWKSQIKPRATAMASNTAQRAYVNRLILVKEWGTKYN